ncbi:Signal transduction histidine kinase [Caloramator fervidus]|uniref:histidine kinase n=2 Tax=Caloramator fervidus TaxID=29344 RepID=A0A1H5T2Y1_9CLOT|nr:Signal transduction histidine kinase [Caloramator fervidus]
MENVDIECKELKCILNEIFLKSPNAIAIFDLNGNIIMKNNMYEEFIKTSKSDIFNTFNLDKNLIIQELKTNCKYAIEKINFIDENNNSLWYKLNFFSIKNYFAVILSNITESIVMSQKIQNDEAIINKFINENTRLQNKLEYEKLKSDFLLRVSHELRTPVNVIYGTIQLIEILKEKDTFIQSFNDFFPILKQNVYRLIKIVNNIVDITSIDAGFMKLNIKNTDIIDLVKNICSSVNSYLKNKNINIIFSSPFKEKYIACDPEKIKKVILNILSNAVKFSKNEKVNISVCILEENNDLIIKIKDDGIGIPKKFHDVIFNRFKQLDPCMTRKNEGCGIGLSLVKEFIKMHKGEIFINSEENKGTEFIIKLPKYEIEDEVAITKNENYLENIQIEFSDIQ